MPIFFKPGFIAERFVGPNRGWIQRMNSSDPFHRGDFFSG